MEHELNLSTTVTLNMTGFGRHIIAKHYGSQEREDFASTSSGSIDESRLKWSTQEIRMPLWEAFAIFGPHIKGSNALPVMSIAVPSIEADLDRLRGDLTARTRDAHRILRLLCELGKAVGLGDLDYCSAEEVTRRVDSYVDEEVSRIPDSCGFWHYGGSVVEVENFGGSMVVRLRNGRRKRVDEMDQDLWRGPAVRDQRTPKFSSDDDEDIPF
jgi:hypothetical protein